MTAELTNDDRNRILREAEALTFIHERVELLNRLIERSESEEEAIYEWASGQ